MIDSRQLRTAIERYKQRRADDCVTIPTAAAHRCNPARTYLGHTEVLFFQPDAGRGEQATFVITCGLAYGLRPSDLPGFELILEVEGRVTRPDRIAHGLADFAFRPLNQGVDLREGKLFTRAWLPPFDRLGNVLVCPWLFLRDQTLELPGGATVQLAQAVPLHDREVAAARDLDSLRDLYHQVAPYRRDPSRQPAGARAA